MHCNSNIKSNVNEDNFLWFQILVSIENQLMLFLFYLERNVLRNKLELKWIKLLQTPHPFGFNDDIDHEGKISR